MRPRKPDKPGILVTCSVVPEALSPSTWQYGRMAPRRLAPGYLQALECSAGHHAIARATPTSSFLTLCRKVRSPKRAEELGRKAFMESLVPGVELLVASLMSALGFPIPLIIAGLTAYALYGWYASARWSVGAVQSAGGAIVRSLRRGGLSIPLSAVWYGLLQVLFVATSSFFYNFVDVIVSKPDGATRWFEEGDVFGSMFREVGTNLFMKTPGVTLAIIAISFLPLAGAVVSGRFRQAFVGIVALPAIAIFAVALISVLMVVMRLIVAAAGSVSFGLEGAVFIISSVSSVVWLYSATGLFLEGEPARIVETET